MTGKNAQTPHWGALQLDPEQVLEHLWQSSIVALTLVTEDGHFLHPSEALCELLEYTPHELERLRFGDVTHPADRNSDIEMARAVAAARIDHYVMSKRYITKTERVVWIKLHVSGFFDEDGEFLLFLSQIAPAEVYNPKAPAVARSLPIETRLRQFMQRNWKVLLPLVGFAATMLYRAITDYYRLMELLDRGEP